VLERLGIEAPDDLNLETRMRRQSDGINDDWARRYSDIRLGAEFDLVPTPSGRD
jgi:LPS sulfotransferase NodH